MRILANENFPGGVIAALRNRGHDVVWIRTDAPGSQDQAVLKRAVAENRIIVTFDKDFGELAFHSKVPALSGGVLFRITTPSPVIAIRRIVEVMESRSDWEGNFTVIDDWQIRMRPLPIK
ncbi:MAG: DUF5615 family PIN-like protein [Thermodesulfobacteriota bacterium]